MEETDEQTIEQKISNQHEAAPSKPPRRTNLKKETKRLGEMAEAAFLSRVTALGFGVSKPWGDSERYDFIVDVKGRIFRVQVKSAHSVSKSSGGDITLMAAVLATAIPIPLTKSTSWLPTSCPRILGMYFLPPPSKRWEAYRYSPRAQRLQNSISTAKPGTFSAK